MPKKEIKIECPQKKHHGVCNIKGCGYCHPIKFEPKKDMENKDKLNKSGKLDYKNFSDPADHCFKCKGNGAYCEEIYPNYCKCHSPKEDKMHCGCEEWSFDKDKCDCKCHSLPQQITKQVGERFKKHFHESCWDDGEYDRDAVLIWLFQTIQDILGCLPEPWEKGHEDYNEGYNDCRKEFIKNLEKLYEIN